jgi:hypothetical protein
MWGYIDNAVLLPELAKSEIAKALSRRCGWNPGSSAENVQRRRRAAE